MTKIRTDYVTGLPLSARIVQSVANDQKIKEEDLKDSLKELDEKIAERIGDIAEEYLWEPEGNSETGPLISSTADRAAFYLPVRDLEELTATLGSADNNIRDAVRLVHQEEAKQMGADSERISDTAALVIWTPKVYRYVDAGLSIQQARVRSCSDGGMSPDEIADDLRMEVGTVKSHLYRASEKIEKCEQLVGLGTGAQAELRILIQDGHTIILQRRLNEDVHQVIEERVENLDQAITDALDDLRIGGGGEPKSGRMDHERMYVDEIPQM